MVSEVDEPGETLYGIPMERVTALQWQRFLAARLRQMAEEASREDAPRRYLHSDWRPQGSAL